MWILRILLHEEHYTVIMLDHCLSIHVRPGINIQLNINRTEAIQRRVTKFILKANKDFNIRLKQLVLQSLHNRRFIRDVFLLNLMTGHFKIDISDKLLFCKEHNVDFNLRKNDSIDLVSIYSTNSFK